uniref:CSON002682 protein n=1 Tax=Culicoides sonorensis TaxID=179676 RepID=A0A336LSP2_CULSO
MCMLERFFCFELQTAGVILGWFATTKSLLSLITATFGYSYIPGLVNQTIIVINNVTNQTDPDAGGYIETSTNVVEGLAVALIALMAIDFIASILLLYGTIQGNRLMLLPWLIENGFGLMYTILVTVILTLAVASNPDQNSPGASVFMGIILCIPLGFSIYCWSAVYSLYHWFAEVDTQRARLLGPMGGKAMHPAYQTYERV